MFKFFSAFRKEWIVLVRDVPGIILLFLMPMVMLVILSLVQEFGWNAVAKEPKIHVLFVNEDTGNLPALIEKGLDDSRMFVVLKKLNADSLTREIAREKVRTGEYQIGVIIPNGASKKIERKVQMMITQIMSGIMMPVGNPFFGMENKDSVNIIIYFDPAIKGTFKAAFLSSMKEYSLKIESNMIFQTFNDELKKLFPQYLSSFKEFRETVYFTEEYPSGEKEPVIATSTQHNVPSWAIFAMFFIVIPLSSSLIKEREEGSVIRLYTLPVSYFTVFMSKVGVYLIVCFVQFIFMVLAGIYLLPLFSLPALSLSNHYFSLTIMALASSMAALGYGIMIGTLANTHQQASAFGSVSIVILAAIGGLWVPIYFFPHAMIKVLHYLPSTGHMKAFLPSSCATAR
jgi:ABC-2 type transport system permease protein